MEVVFWISLFLLFYAYLGYGLLLSVISAFSSKRQLPGGDSLPPVTLVVAAYNEEASIEAKIQNCLLLRYPPDLLTLVFVTDGSTDNTPHLVSRHPSLVHLHRPERRGKTAALNRAMQQVQTPVVVFTDANAMLHPESIRKMVRHYHDERIGGVSGEKRILSGDDTAVGTGERIYWQYESMLKRADAAFYTVIGAAGELFSIRSSLFEPLDEAIILDDFVLSAKVCLKGYRFAYEKEAYTLESPSENLSEEKARKIRISAGCFQALALLKALLNPGRNWRLTFQYISHRVLRWVLCPLLIPLLFVSNSILYLQDEGSFYELFFAGQAVFYLFALFGWLLPEKKGFFRLFYIPYYFVFMNISLWMGFFRFLSGQQSASWKKASRKTSL